MPLRVLRLLQIAAATAALTLTGLSLQSASVTRAQSAAAVSMISNRFQPGTMTIAAGSTITWVNNEDPNGTDVTHDVIADDNSWSSNYLAPGQSYSLEFDTPGTFTYYCDLHDGMVGTIVVQ
jgi:plastocyanin